MRFVCLTCGCEVNDSDKFCAHCGNNLKNDMSRIALSEPTNCKCSENKKKKKFSSIGEIIDNINNQFNNL